ncbi:MAG: SO_0444 family Cu/Zn efflux transporter [Halothiobacillaceae bacterium]
MDLISQFVRHLVDLVRDAAFWLLLGLFIAGLLKSWMRTDGLARHLGRDGLGTSVKASLIGAPLPLCSCGVIPVALGLRRAGASRSATSAFLVATPQTGPDSVALTWAMLGPVMAVARPLAAVVTAVVAGVLTGWTARDRAASQAPPVDTGGCCKGTGCSSAESSAKTPEQAGAWRRFLEGQRYAFVEVFGSFIGWLVIGLVFAAAVQSAVPESWLAGWGDSLLALLVMALVGLPMYVCATAATPIAAGLMAAGMAPGTALVFLLTGPVANIATLGLVRKELGNHALAAYLVAVLGTAMLFGAGLNALLPGESHAMTAATGHDGHETMLGIDLLAAFALVLLTLWHAAMRIRPRLTR